MAEIERRRGERRKSAIMRNRLILGAYALIVFLTALGFYLFDREAQQRDKALCLRGNELRTGIQGFIREVSGNDPESKEYLDKLISKYFELNEKCPPGI